MHDTDLVCLTQLQRLHVTAQMVSPAVVSALGALPSLTHMHLDQLDWRLYGGLEEPAPVAAGGSEDFLRGRDLAKALRGLTVRRMENRLRSEGILPCRTLLARFMSISDCASHPGLAPL